jgi:hypothetical protein
MMRSNINTNGKPVKRPAFHHSKNSRGMRLLYHPSTVIELGEYAGKKFGYVLKHYGKKAFPELLRFYRISSRIMDEYHCTLRPHVDKPGENQSAPIQKSFTLSMKEVDMVTDTVTNQTDKDLDVDDVREMTSKVELDDTSRWTTSRSDYENNILYDPEDDVPDSYLDEILMGDGLPHSRSNRNKWQWDNADC